MLIDLKAHRCPTAQVLMNRVLEKFSQMDESELKIMSIEPSLERNTKARIAGLGLNMSIVCVEQRPLSNTDITKWSSEFDEEDYDGVNGVVTITIQKDPQRINQE